MEIKFTSKEESKRIQEFEFLALPPSERFLRFLSLSQQINSLFPTSVSKEKSNNFILELYKTNDRKLG